MNEQAMILQTAIESMVLESESIKFASEKLGENFIASVQSVAGCQGRIITSGMGKSGQVARKISSTLSSLGSPSFFMHPAEGLHGDLGMITTDDIFIMISYSGETEELIRILAYLRQENVQSIIISGASNSTLARHCNIFIDGYVPREACAHNLAPTCSTAVAMAIGDAIAVSASVHKGFAANDFAKIHPGGSLGRLLLTTVGEVMRTQDLPCCSLNTPLKEIIAIMTSGKLGVAFVTSNTMLEGIITDGDLRRSINGLESLDCLAGAIMTRFPLSIAPNIHLQDAANILTNHCITILPVVADGKLVGAIQLANCI